MSLNEVARLKTLQSFQLLDTPADILFDNLAKMAALVCNCSMAGVSLVDESRVWFKAQWGFTTREIPRGKAPCSLVIEKEVDFIEILDLAMDERTRGHSLVEEGPPLKYYFGIPLITAGGDRIGVLCLFDTNSKSTMASEVFQQLKMIAQQVMVLFDLHRKTKENQYVQKRLLESSRASLINEMTKGIAHEINNPLTVIMTSMELLAMKAGGMKDPKVSQLMTKMKGNIQLIQKVVATVKEMSSAQADSHYGTYASVIPKSIELVEQKFPGVKIRLQEQNLNNAHVQVPLPAQQVLFHMLTNACFAAKKNTAVPVAVSLTVTLRGEHLLAQVQDSGVGVPEDKIANLFGILFHSNYKGEAIGIGLSTCKSIVEGLGGSIRFVANGPTTFEIGIPVKVVG